MSDARLQSPSAARNRQPILEVLQASLPSRARVLEIASGSGEHAVHFATAMPGWEWHPSDTAADALASIDAWRRHTGLSNLREPVELDVTRHDWPTGPFDAVVAINLIHISPWEVTQALLAGARERLADAGLLVLYGPYKRDGRHTAASNAAFDADLKSRDPRWGLRDVTTVRATAEQQGFTLERVVEMPANNLSLVFRGNLTLMTSSVAATTRDRRGRAAP